MTTTDPTAPLQPGEHVWVEAEVVDGVGGTPETRYQSTPRLKIAATGGSLTDDDGLFPLATAVRWRRVPDETAAEPHDCGAEGDKRLVRLARGLRQRGVFCPPLADPVAAALSEIDGRGFAAEPMRRLLPRAAYAGECPNCGCKLARTARPADPPLTLDAIRDVVREAVTHLAKVERRDLLLLVSTGDGEPVATVRVDGKTFIPLGELNAARKDLAEARRERDDLRGVMLAVADRIGSTSSCYFGCHKAAHAAANALRTAAQEPAQTPGGGQS